MDDLAGEQLALEHLTLWVALPIALFAAVLVSVKLRGPQRALFGMFGAATRGGLSGAVASSAVTIGAAGILGAGTAVSLGGPGAIPWIWITALVLSALRASDLYLGRTAPIGKPGALRSMTLAGREAARGGPGRISAFVLGATGLLASAAATSVLHVPALRDGLVAFRRADSTMIVGAALALALAVAVLARKRPIALLVVGALGLLALALSALLACAADPGRAFGAISRG